LCLLSSSLGDTVVNVIIGEHHLFTLLAVADVDVAKIASAHEIAQRAD
jgi:hypothetical protein